MMSSRTPSSKQRTLTPIRLTSTGSKTKLRNQGQESGNYGLVAEESKTQPTHRESTFAGVTAGDATVIQDFGELAVAEEEEQLRAALEKLFVYYCDFSVDKGVIFIKQASFLKLLKDAQIVDSGVPRSWKTLTEKEVILLISKECNNPLIKSLDFQEFLNILVKIALLVKPGETPKASLQRMLGQHVIPLLQNIEESISYQKANANHTSSITLNG